VASVSRDVLAPFADHSRIRERLNRLRSISQFDFQNLKKLGIEYKSPVDFVQQNIEVEADFIFSNSLLNRILIPDIPILLRNLCRTLNKGGTMIHCLHLEDHNNINNNPFGFLEVPEKDYSHVDQFSRGNRIRFSEWRKIFDRLEGVKVDYIFNYARLDMALPDSVDSCISHDDEIDLRTSHIGVFIRKK
jgi:hypothetical protein